VTEALYLALHDSLWAFVRRRVSSDADADDVVQDVFLRMHTRMHTLDDQSSARAWAFAIARNALIDHHRRQARAPETLAHEPAAPEVDELDGLEADVAAFLGVLLHELPAADRQALELTDLGALSQQQAATTLGLSPSGMRSRVQRGRRRLRTALEQCCRIELDRRRQVIACESDDDCC